jgi:hypothetical protein
MSCVRSLETYLGFGHGSEDEFDTLSFFLGSLSISLTSPEQLKFNIGFDTLLSPFEHDTFYVNLRNAWSHLDSITTHPTSSQLQRVDINISYRHHRRGWLDNVVEPDKNEISKAVLGGLPLLSRKGILFVKVVLKKI